MESEVPLTRGKKIKRIKFRHPPPPEVTQAPHPIAATQPTPASELTPPAHQCTLAPQPSSASYARVTRNHQSLASQQPTSQNSVPDAAIAPVPSLISQSHTSPPNQEIAHQQPTTQNGGDFDFAPQCTKRKRGKSIGKGTIELMSANGGKKLVVVWDPDHWVPSDKTINQKFTSEIGITIRSYAPVYYRGWSKIGDDIKRKLREKLETLFEVDIHHPKVIKYVHEVMTTAYTQFKWKLHNHYKECRTPERARATLPSPDLWNGRPQEHWHCLCDKVYSNADYMEICATNTQNRNQQESTHRGGAMPFIQHALQAAKDSGKPVSFIDNYESMYQVTEHKWVSDTKRVRHEKMKQRREDVKAKLIEEAPEGTPLESVQVALNDEIAIMIKECGRKGSKVHGVGAFPCLDISSSSSSMPINSKWNEMKGNLQKLSSTVNTLEFENAKLKSMLRAIFSKLHGSTNNNGNYEDDDSFVQGSDGIEGIDDFPDNFPGMEV